MLENSNALDFGWRVEKLTWPQPAREPKKPAFMLRKLMPEYVYDLVHLEGNPFTFVEVQTLLDGITIGGHRLLDQTQVLNQFNGLKLLLQRVTQDNLVIDANLARTLHAQIAREEALEWGTFRKGEVRISGTGHQPPPYRKLSNLYRDGIAQINQIKHPFERALVYYFWAARQQFFYDGNKRTARAMMNAILLTHGYYYLSVPAAKREAFDQMMVDFYDTADASAGMSFMQACYRDWD